ncbi:MAG: hypothetical protein RJA83_842 [Pseudomonadota bacterium]
MNSLKMKLLIMLKLTTIRGSFNRTANVAQSVEQLIRNQ